MPLNTFTLTLADGRRAWALRLPPEADVRGLGAALGLGTLGGAVALIGGASAFDGPLYADARHHTRRLLATLAEAAATHNLAWVDGGTPYGVMKLAGEVCVAAGDAFPIIGVVPSGKVAFGETPRLSWRERLRGDEDDRPQLVTLDTHHRAFVLVISDEWGAEVQMIAAVTHELGGGKAVAVLANGGLVARLDVAAHIEAGIPVIVLAGTGRFADELAMALREDERGDPSIAPLLASGKLHLFDVNAEAENSARDFVALVRRLGGF